METSLKQQAAMSVLMIRPFLSVIQLAVMSEGCRGNEKEFFLQKFVELAELIDKMPVTYEQSSKGDEATVYLHYFLCNSDWYITEKDLMGGVRQAFGYSVLGGDDRFAELGYISIREIVRLGGELDLHFTPCTLREIKAKRAGKTTSKAKKPWVIVTRPGCDDEKIFDEYATLTEAIGALEKARLEGDKADVMKRLSDGTLTTEY